ncbi:hypothetical protein U3516DRAFT_770710 [Neocallimastix sp. 'constans']
MNRFSILNIPIFTKFLKGVSGYNKVLPCHTISTSTLSVTDYRTTRFGDVGYGFTIRRNHPASGNVYVHLGDDLFDLGLGCQIDYNEWVYALTI